MITAEQVAEVLKNPKKKADGSWMACCRAHDDKTPSLSVMDGDDVAVVLKCFAGCDYKNIAEALELQHGIKLSRSGGASVDTHRKLAPSNWPSTYHYFDENHLERYIVCRMYNGNGDKMFKQYRPDGNGGYASSIEGIERLPYRLPFWKDLDPIVMVEGEKDVDTLAKYGVAATCNSGGANNWGPELNKWFTGKTIYIIPDNDEPGRKHARSATVAQLFVFWESVTIRNYPATPAQLRRNRVQLFQNLIAQPPQPPPYGGGAQLRSGEELFCYVHCVPEGH